MFHWENTIVLDAMQGNWASSRGEWGVSWDLSSCGISLGYILELRQECPFETRVCLAKSRHCLGTTDTSGILNLAWQDNSDSSAVEMGDQASFSSFPSDIGIPIDFQEESGIVTF